MTDERVINQGDLYWVQLEDEEAVEPRIPHPHLVVQDNLFNHSRVHTVIVCALTSNLKKASIPGNVLLDTGEGGLTRQSVIEVAKVSSIEKAQLGEYIGTLNTARIEQVLTGLRFVQTSFFGR